MTETAINNIVLNFRVLGKVILSQPFGSGHINDSYRIVTDDGNEYLLQKINSFVFKDVPGLMNNLVKVIQHLKQKLASLRSADPERESLTLVGNINGGFYLEDNSDYWRVFHFLKNTKSYDQVLTEKQAFEGGKAFGRFQALLCDMDPGALTDTIPNFHDIEHRLINLDKAILSGALDRADTAIAEIEFAAARRQRMGLILQLGRNHVIPLRIIHNDTKFSNVLLNEQDEAQCVIDLDTVMPGYAAYDFGDAIRTIINTAPEDEPDLQLIQLNVPLFTAYVNGYFQETRTILTDDEIKSLMEGVLLLPYMQGVRFLTDYLDGDGYFKIHFPMHNLQRAKAQFQLVKRLEGLRNVLNDIILDAWHRYKNM